MVRKHEHVADVIGCVGNQMLRERPFIPYLAPAEVKRRLDGLQVLRGRYAGERLQDKVDV